MANTYLTRTNSSPTNAKKYTWSSWNKIDKRDWMPFFSTTHQGGHSYIGFGASSSKHFGVIEHGDSAGTLYQVATSSAQADSTGWYHVVVQFDSTQSTASDRLKIYINNVLQTSFTVNNYPPQNLDSWFVDATTIEIGRRSNGSGKYYSGLISHAHFIDGTVYAPSTFGETDSTTGEWKIKTDPGISTANYGNNGFWMFKDNNSLNDNSGNSNNFTVGGGTLTKTEDCPSNVFATLNPLYRSNVSSQHNIGFNHGNTTWYPSSASNTHSWGRSTLGWTSGKYYMEFKVEEAGGGQASGVWMVPTELPNSTSPQSTSNTAYGWQVQFSGSDQNLYTTNGGTTVATITSSVGANPIIMMAIDADNNKMWVGHNGTWYNNNNASTTLNTSYPDHTWTPGTYGDMYQLAFQAYYSSGAYNNAYGNFGNGYFGTTAVSSAGTNASGNGIFEYDVPTGYTALSTKGLNL